jgi:hypothetical protein
VAILPANPIGPLRYAAIDYWQQPSGYGSLTTGATYVAAKHDTTMQVGSSVG